MAEFAVFMYHPDGAGGDDPASLAEHDTYAREMTGSGEMVFGRALAGTTATVSLRRDGQTDGPYLEAAESVVGFYVVQADDLEAALAVVRRNPILSQGGGVEVRPVA
jgi:hypothetical protein